LKLYADNLSWDKETLTFAPGDSLGQQAGVPEWQRKEHLYHEVCFNQQFPRIPLISFFFRLSVTLTKESAGRKVHIKIENLNLKIIPYL
jgi:hypothetical protein